VFRLKRRGYRGDALPFALWWLGVRPWTPGVARYVSSLFRYSQQRLQADLQAEARKAGMAPTGVDSPLDDPDGLSIIDIARTYAEQSRQPSMLKLAAQINRALDSSSTLSADQVSEVVLVWMASMLGLYPEDLDVGAFFLERDLPPAVVSAMHLPEWYDDLMTRVQAARAALYDLARLMLQPRVLAWEGEDRYSAPLYQLASVLSFPPYFARDHLRVVKCLSDRLRQRVSAREEKRLGPLVRPALATRGLLVGMTVFHLTITEERSREVEGATGF
jgi:hypothetical protein